MNSSHQTGAPGSGGYSHTRAGRMLPNSPRLKPGAVLTIASLALIIASCVPGAASLPQPTQNTNQSTPVPQAALTLAVGNSNYQLTSGGPIEVAYNGGQPITLPENIFTIEEGTFDRYGNINGCATVSPSPPAVVKVDTPISIALDLACYNGLSLGTDKPSLGLLITHTSSKTVYQVALTGWPDQVKMTATAAPTVLPTATIAPTGTIAPTATVPPTPTRDPSVPLMMPKESQSFNLWAWPGSIQVWTNSTLQLLPCNSGDSRDFYCGPTNNQHTWKNSQPWTYAGSIDDKTSTVMFKEPTKTLVIIAGSNFDIDQIYGILKDGTKVPLGYTLDPSGKLTFEGKKYSPTSLFADSGGPLDMDPFIKYELEWKTIGQDGPCGMVGLAPDNSVTTMGNNSWMLFRMLTDPIEKQAIRARGDFTWNKRGDKAFELYGLKIVFAQPNSQPTYCK